MEQETKTLYSDKANSSMGLKRGREKINGAGMGQSNTKEPGDLDSAPLPPRPWLWRRAEGDGRVDTPAPALGGGQGSAVCLYPHSQGCIHHHWSLIFSGEYHYSPLGETDEDSYGRAFLQTPSDHLEEA